MSKKQQAPSFPLRLPAEVKAHFGFKAKREERSLNWMICKELKDVMERDRASA